MKKILLIALAAVAVLAGCSKDETLKKFESSQTIGFSSFVNNSTKATDATVDNLGTIEVYGWKDVTSIFDAQEVTIAEDGTGTYTPIQYWEASSDYTFEAFYPTGLTITASSEGSTISFTNDAETDLLYSGVETVSTAESLSSDDPGTVEFTLNHLLSRVKFTFVNNFTSEITISSVKITNAYETGTYAESSWSSQDGELEVSFEADDESSLEGISTDSGSGYTTGMFFIPAEDIKYSISFSVTYTLNNEEATTAHTATVTLSNAAGYSYNLVATLDESNIAEDELYPIEFAVEEVSDWTDAGDTDIEVE